MGRFAKPTLLGRCRGSEVASQSSKEVFEHIRDLSLGFASLGMRTGDRIAILSESRPEWICADLAVLAGGGVTVPIYATLSVGHVRYILEDSGARIAVVSTKLQLEKLQEVRHQLPALEAIVVMDAAAAGALSPSVLAFETVAERGHARMTSQWGAGRDFRETARTVKPEQLATIIYTSGTTGEPKGVMLTHANLVANLHAGAKALEVHQDDVALSFLPLSHAFERMVAYIYLLCGVTIVFAESFETIGRDLPAVKPTVLTGVPRVYEKLHSRIMDKGQAGSAVKTALFRWAIAAGVKRARAILHGKQPGPLTSMQAALADRLVFAKIRDGLGGRIRYLVSGSAPLSAAVAEFFYGIGLPVIEGYGLTETAPILTVNPADAPRAGTVGKAVAGVELRIAADGEILARGPNVMAGYYNKPQATADVLKDGWFHTGDIGDDRCRWLPGDHRPQEGPPRHLGRQEDRATTHRGRAEAQSDRQRSGSSRRPSKVRRGAPHSRLQSAGPPAAGSRPAAASRIAAGAVGTARRARALPGNRRRAQPRSLAVPAHQTHRAPAHGVFDRERRADADAQSEAQGG